ncbi:MAG: ABC transporter ATP-binding protein [Chlorobi bacterium]|nr:ABC transporter ATP-binding protein [Chlorobiota bacterium]MCI0715650.1 ABC transporter ATP-binding protein [Chlorobiota bacterium]
MSIKVSNLTKYYGNFLAVDDISFETKKGEILGFLGPNGAGKTTTMKIITTYLPPTSGTVQVEGMDVEEKSLEVRRKIGYLPEINPLYFDMSPAEYLDYVAALDGVPKENIKKRRDEMIRVCGLESVKGQDIGTLSKGFKQRVGLAQAMINNPEVLILDEPTSGLDPNQIIEIRNLIKKLGREKTVVLSTHILPEVQATCNRVIIINKGKIVADGTPEELQAKSKGESIVTLEVKNNCDKNSLSGSLKEIRNVNKVEFVKDTGDSFIFNIYGDKGADLREVISTRVMQQKTTLLSMQTKQSSLEDIFRELTR